MTKSAETNYLDLDFLTLEMAARWFALLQSDSVTENERQAWHDWLHAKPKHRLAWQCIEEVGLRCEQVRNLDSNREALATALKAERLGSEERRRFLRGMGMLAGVGLLSWGAWRHTPLGVFTQSLNADYRTGTGQRQSITLDDGSRLWLNTASALDVLFSQSERRLLLRQGEILINTNRDPRPFYVETSEGMLQALGTRFNVRLMEDKTRLSVYEGKVKITTKGQLSELVPGGQQTQFSKTGIAPLMQSDPDDAAWIRARLVANHIRLADFVDELQRYRHGYIHLDPAIADLRVMGTFPADDTAYALGMLEQVLPVRVEQTLPWWTSITAR